MTTAFVAVPNIADLKFIWQSLLAPIGSIICKKESGLKEAWWVVDCCEYAATCVLVRIVLRSGVRCVCFNEGGFDRREHHIINYKDWVAVGFSVEPPAMIMAKLGDSGKGILMGIAHNSPTENVFKFSARGGFRQFTVPQMKLMLRFLEAKFETDPTLEALPH